MTFDHATCAVDANVAVAWSLTLPWSERAAAYRSPENWLVAPDLIVPEIGSALWQNVRARVIDAEQAEEAYQAVAAFIEVVPSTELRRDALALAILLDHSIYDCFHLALARLSRVPIVTADRQMAERARLIDIPVDFLSAQART